MPKPAYPIIDTHQHLWELERMKPPWLKGAGPPLEAKNFIEEYTTAIAGLPIAMAIYMEVNVASDQKQLEAERVIRLIQSGNTLTKAAILSANPAAPGFRPFVDQFEATDCVKGYRQVLHSKATPPGYCLSPTFIENCRHLGKQGKTFDLCLRTGELKDGAQLAAACPDTRFIVNHCGNADPKAFFSLRDPRRGSSAHDAATWQADMVELAKHPNVYCKISGIIARVPKTWSPEELRPIVQHCVEAFGPKRVVFGSDWPVCNQGGSLKLWVEALATITANWPKNAQDRLWNRNAKMIYHIA